MISKTDIIESLLFASDKPVPLKKLAQVVELTLEETMAELDALREEKNSIGSIQLIEVAGGWQLATKPQFSTYIRQLRDAPRQRLSRAAFEVLAVVAYRQPVTRSEIEALRGVDCSGPVQFLLEKKLLAFAGRKDAPGRPHLYATTPEFLDHFGLRDLKDLPTLEELAQLNGGALVHNEIHDGDRLFNRGAMRSEESAAEESAAEESTVEIDRTPDAEAEPEESEVTA
jgi:segregation and condensation protein B